MSPWRVLLFFVTVRLCTVFLVQTWYVPDEYWQTVEVAHHMVFGYGHLTWEWIHGIRSYIYPLFLASILSVIKLFRIDSINAVIYGPRILQAVFSAVGDYCFLKWYKRQNNGNGMWATFALCTNWFWLYCGSRTLINTFEATLNTIALSLFPWNHKYADKNSSFLWFVGIACMVRPTAVAIWLPLCIYNLIMSHDVVDVVLKNYIPKGLLIGLCGILIDSYCYKELTFTPLNFLNLNIIKDIGIFYGTHPKHWYVTIGLPVALGCHFIPFLLGAYKVVFQDRNQKDTVLVLVILWTVAVLSFVPHKEFRFLLPLMPMFVFIETKWLSHWSRKMHASFIWFVAIVLFVSNIGLLAYLGLVHQRGNLDAMKTLAARDPNNTNVMILMPCHSTPLYSHLHTKLKVRFLTCEPDFTGNKDYQDEAEVFYSNPDAWLRKNSRRLQFVSHILMYDSLYSGIEKYLTENHYRLNSSFFHTFHPSDRVGKFVQIYTNQN